MSLRPDVVEAENGAGAEAALDGEHVFLGVRNAVGGGVVGKAGDGRELGPVDGIVGIFCAGIQRSELDGKNLRDLLAGGGGDERSGEERRSGAGVGGAVGSV